MFAKTIYISLVGLLWLYLSVPLIWTLHDVVFYPLTKSDGAPNFLRTAMATYSLTTDSWLHGKALPYLGCSVLAAFLLLAIFRTHRLETMLMNILSVALTSVVVCVVAKIFLLPTERMVLLLPFALMPVVQGILIGKTYTGVNYEKPKFV